MPKLSLIHIYMPEGKFCNRRPINTEEDLKALLGDKGGQQYYKEMEMLEVDTVALWETLQKTCKSRTRTWLEIDVYKRQALHIHTAGYNIYLSGESNLGRTYMLREFLAVSYTHLPDAWA